MGRKIDNSWRCAQSGKRLIKRAGKDVLSYRISNLSGDKDGDMLGYLGLCPKQKDYEDQPDWNCEHSFWLNLYDGAIYINGKFTQYIVAKQKAGDICDMIINVSKGTLQFKINGVLKDLVIE